MLNRWKKYSKVQKTTICSCSILGILDGDNHGQHFAKKYCISIRLEQLSSGGGLSGGGIEEGCRMDEQWEGCGVEQ
jgi:hypothetical protein